MQTMLPLLISTSIAIEPYPDIAAVICNTPPETFFVPVCVNHLKDYAVVCGFGLPCYFVYVAVSSVYGYENYLTSAADFAILYIDLLCLI